MKLLTGIRRELLLLSRGVYFYVELFTAVLFLAMLLFVLPEHLDTRVTEYYFLDGSPAEAAALEQTYFIDNKNMTRDDVAIEIGGEEKPARRYTEDLKYAVVLDNREDLILLTEETGRAGIVISPPDGEGPAFTYYLQGYETDRYKSYAALVAGSDIQAVSAAAEAQPVRVLEPNAPVLNDRQNALPLMLTLNCVLMGILVTAATIVEDKKTNAIRALRVAPAPVAGYLMAKTAAVLLTSQVTCLVLSLPVMRGIPSYPLLALTVLCGGFFTAALGALIAGFYSDMDKAFAVVYIVLMALLVPAAAALLPGWNPAWLKVIPSYFILQGVRDALMHRETLSVLGICGGCALAGALVLALAARRYRVAGIGR